MKLIIDLFPCQSASRKRGIGRYTLNIATALANTRNDNDIILFANPAYQESFEFLRHHFSKLLPLGSFKPYHLPNRSLFPDLVSYEKACSSVLNHLYETEMADHLLIPSHFEGYHEKGVVPEFDYFRSSINTNVILYDFIPYIFQEHYLTNNPEYKNFYFKKLNKITQYDYYFAISEQTKNDAKNILDIRTSSITSIMAACDKKFRNIEIKNETKQKINEKFGIEQKFIFYVGNDEYRKNVIGVINAFTKLEKPIIEKHQLVISGVKNNQSIINEVKKFNFSTKKRKIILLDYIPDDDLIILYNLCKLFVFPSLYEGFGLPVLEAMSCGAPVIASKNAAISEIIEREDMLFDPTDQKQFIDILIKVLKDGNLRNEFSQYGIKRAKEFSWEKSAKIIWDYLQENNKQNKIKQKSSKYLRKPKVAYFSPLPPQKSGIANYSADLLPYLSDHIDVTLILDPNFNDFSESLLEKYDTLTVDEFRKNSKTFDTYLYHFGNSNFHTYMPDLLRQNPGIVVMHDFFLNNIYYVKEFINGEKDTYKKSLIKNQGVRGVIEDLTSGVNETRRKLPLNWEILKYSKVIIAHSEFHNSLLTKYFLRWIPKLEIINHIRYPGANITTAERHTLRRDLGFSKNDFIIGSFGFIAETKLTLKIIKSFSQLRKFNQSLQLILIGQNDGGIYGKKINQYIKDNNLSNVVSITGFIPEDFYKNYLLVSDLAIQLRTETRGETSGAVLDCLSHGLPIIINAFATLNDYPNDIVYKISENFSIKELSKAITLLIDSENYRLELSKNAYNYIKINHSPEKIAKKYSMAIEQAIQIDDRSLLNPILSHPRISRELQIKDIAKILACNLQIRDQNKLLIDVTDIAENDWGGGIQRVVRNILKQFYSMDCYNIKIQMVRLHNGSIIRANRFLEKLLDLEINSLGVEKEILIQQGDHLFLLDASWSFYSDFEPIIEKIKNVGGKIITMVYDLIPIFQPETCHQVVLDVFEPWLNMSLLHSDQIICISKSTADDLQNYISRTKTVPDDYLDISWFHIGAGEKEKFISEENIDHQNILTQLKNSRYPIFLMVGTIEPRKNHTFVLDAFDQLWAENFDGILVIVGKIGWNVDRLMKRIKTHQEYGNKLFFLEKPNDEILEEFYQISISLIIASHVEGFGLPIIEAAMHNTPVIASNIPVFHEVAGDGALYFSLDDADSLRKAVIKMSKLSDEERKNLVSQIKWLTWKESAENLIDLILGKKLKPLSKENY